MKTPLPFLLLFVTAFAGTADEVGDKTCICFNPSTVTIIQPEADIEPPPPSEAQPTWIATPLGDAGFHPSEDTPSLRLPIEIPAGSYTRVRFYLEVMRDGWPEKPSDLQNLIWLVRRSRRGRPENRFMLFYVNVRGPGDSHMMLRSGWGTRQSDKSKVIRPFAMERNRFYAIEGDFDLTKGRVSLRIDGEHFMISEMKNSPPGLAEIEIRDGQMFHAELGFDGSKDGEVPFEGTYRNLRIALYE